MCALCVVGGRCCGPANFREGEGKLPSGSLAPALIKYSLLFFFHEVERKYKLKMAQISESGLSDDFGSEMGQKTLVCVCKCSGAWKFKRHVQKFVRVGREFSVFFLSMLFLVEFWILTCAPLPLPPPPF